MHLTKNRSLFLMAASLGCLGLWLYSARSGMSQDAAATSPRLRELQQQRLATLEEAQDVAKELHAGGRMSLEEVHAVHVELLAARRDYAVSPQARIVACDEAVEEASAWYQIVQEQRAASRATRVHELQAQAYLLETRIARQNAASAR